jgi:anaerobic magnesium-protoporphyrin IX monomethyl ester cyclase
MGNKQLTKILLLRTFKNAGLGGPLPPLDLLYIASMVIKVFKNRYELKLVDMGLGNLSLYDIEKVLDDFSPQIIVFSSLVWEADLVHAIASLAKGKNKNIILVVEGQLASIAKEYLLQDENIDYCITGEAETPMVGLLKSLESQMELSEVKSLIYRTDGNVISNKSGSYIENLDELTISSSAWDLIDVREYARYPNWNGTLKERFYIPILTSRGCPFDCNYCCERELLGKKFRTRSPENVFSEIMFLHKKYNVKEIHIFDSVFNYDVERAKQICRLIIDSRIKLSLSFPHGLRADIMTEELLALLRKAGTYKLVYGIETAVPRLQRMINKSLDIRQVNEVIKMTSKTGIIVGGYFMLGFATETIDEMRQTMNFAVQSDLDLAYFFKVTRFQDIVDIYKSHLNPINGDRKDSCIDLCYYGIQRSAQGILPSQLNNLLLEAQQRFYLSRRRLLRGFVKSPRKISFLKNLSNLGTIILQSYLVGQLVRKDSSKKCSEGL